MKKFILFPFFIFGQWLFTACNTATPENYFDIAVLSCNSLHGFASNGLEREFDNPTVRMVNGNKDQFAPMKREEIIDGKIQIIEPNLEKLKRLKETDDSKEILQASLSLYEYVLPVYKNEYRQLAKLYDEGASREQIESLQLAIHDKYYPGFELLFGKLTTAGKPFAERHSIKVNWDIRMAP